MIKFTLVVWFMCLAIPGTLIAQEATPQADTVSGQTPPPAPKKNNFKDKVYYGGYVNLSFGSYTVIGIEPMIAYKLTTRLSLGAKFRYDYIRDKRYLEDYDTYNWGASVFSRFRAFKGLYLHAEYAGYNYEKFAGTESGTREWVPFLLVGAGYSQPIGKRTSVNAQVLFDVLQSDKSPYRSWEPFYSIGVGVGF